MDTMVRRAYKNRVHSALLRLPERLLVRIMEEVDLDCLLRLRHTSRDFMRLFSSEPRFSHHHLAAEQASKRYQQTARIWTPPTAFFHDQALSALGPLCSACSEKRGGDVFGTELMRQMPSLHCSRCHVAHKVFHFSALERQETDDAQRICLGHQYPFRICSHSAQNIDQLIKFAKYRSNLLISCGKSHNEGRPRCEGVACFHDGQADFRCYLDIQNKPRLEVRFSAHVNFRRKASGRACPHNLRTELRELDRTETVGKWKGQHAFASADPLRAFDPNICDCVEWATPTQSLHSRWGLHPDGNVGWRESVLQGSYVQSRGRCAGRRHGFTTRYEGIKVDVDFFNCPHRTDLLIFQQKIDCALDAAFAAGPGWGNLNTAITYRPTDDALICGTSGCPDENCALHKLAKYGKHAGVFWG